MKKVDSFYSTLKQICAKSLKKQDEKKHYSIHSFVKSLHYTQDPHDKEWWEANKNELFPVVESIFQIMIDSTQFALICLYMHDILEHAPNLDVLGKQLEIPVTFYEFISNYYLRAGLLQLITLHSQYSARSLAKHSKKSIEKTHRITCKLYGSCIEFMHLETPWHPNLTRIIYDHDKFNHSKY